MRIAIYNYCWNMASESFSRREANALRDLGHEVAAFKIVPELPGQPTVEPTIPSFMWNEVAQWKPDVLYGSMSVPAHRKMWYAANDLNIPFAFRLWSGLDVFDRTNQQPEFYRKITSDAKCLGCFPEDAFMERFVRQHLAIQGKTFVVANSLDVEEYACPPMVQTPMVLAIGRFVEKKGFRYFVEAGRRLPKFQFILAGGGPLEAELKANRPSNLSFPGWVSHDEIKSLIYQSRCVIAPCVQTPTGDADGVPTTVLEAFACGRPAIGPDLLCMPDYIREGETGLLYRPGKTSELVDAIAHLCTSRETAEQLGRQARAFAEQKLDIRKNIKIIEGVLCPGRR